MRRTRTTNSQDVESRRQLRSRIAQGLNVQEHASALRSAAVLPDSDFEHPGENRAVSKPILGVSRRIQPQRAYMAGTEKTFSPHFLRPHTPFAIGYKLFIAECAALIVYSISRVE